MECCSFKVIVALPAKPYTTVFKIKKTIIIIIILPPLIDDACVSHVKAKLTGYRMWGMDSMAACCRGPTASVWECP